MAWVFPFTKVILPLVVGVSVGAPLATMDGSPAPSTLDGVSLTDSALPMESVDSSFPDIWVDGEPILGNTLSFSEQRKSEALKQLDGKRCKQIKNPSFKGAWFGALWICKRGDKDGNGYWATDFYYLDRDKSKNTGELYLTGSAVGDSISSNLSDLLSKVVGLTYHTESGSEKAHISLKFGYSGEEKRLEVPAGSVWSNFKGENPSSVCKIGEMQTRGDLLQCQLTSSDEFKDQNGKAHYHFSVT